MSEKLGITTVLGLVGLAVSACYLMVFWGSFGIDIFQFTGLTDFVKLAIFPVSLALMTCAVGLALALLIIPYRPSRNSNEKDLGVGGQKIVRLFATVSIVAAIVTIGSTNASLKWMAAACIAFPAVLSLYFLPITRRHFPSRALRLYLLVVITEVPLTACFFGAANAEAIKEGVATRVIDPTGIAAGLMGTRDHPLVYVGFVSDTFVIYETQTGSVILLKQVDNAPLVLKPNPNAARRFASVWRVLTASHND